jgi:hypothetical protein
MQTDYIHMRMLKAKTLLIHVDLFFVSHLIFLSRSEI